MVQRTTGNMRFCILLRVCFSFLIQLSERRHWPILAFSLVENDYSVKLNPYLFDTEAFSKPNIERRLKSLYLIQLDC
jgi:hypothetical protein